MPNPSFRFDCFKDLIVKLARQAAKSSPAADGAEQAEKMRLHYTTELTKLQENATDELTIRMYLELHENCLRLFGFSDPWREQKAVENAFAISRFRDRIDVIDSLGEQGDERWITLCNGLLAGVCVVTMFVECNREIRLSYLLFVKKAGQSTIFTSSFLFFSQEICLTGALKWSLTF